MDDKYRGSGNSQVRNIIGQLNDVVPSREKSREVVVREDGTKVIRVTKKRRVMVSAEEKSKKTRRGLMMGVLVCFLAAALVVAFFVFRMSSMSGEAYLTRQSDALREQWGATSVKCVGADMDGSSFKVDSLKAEFPESSMLVSLELSGIKAEVNASTFFSGVLTGDKIEIDRARLVLRAGADKLQLPQHSDHDLWRYNRFDCKELAVEFEESAGESLSLTDASAYLYALADRSSSHVLMLNSGVLRMPGWKTVHVDSAKFLFSPLGIEDFNIQGSADGAQSLAEDNRSSLSVSGSIAEGSSWAGPHTFDSNNMNLADLTASRFIKFFNARTVTSARGKTKSLSRVLLPLGAGQPVFSGEMALKNVAVTSFPGLELIPEHLEGKRRKKYMPPMVAHGRINLLAEDGALTLKMEDGAMVERDVISLRGTIRVDAGHELSGTLDYGIPSRYTHAEYPDGVADPVFDDNGETSWLCTHLSGPANVPMDDSPMIEARAQEARKSRPARNQLDDVNLERVIQTYSSQAAVPSSTAPESERVRQAPEAQEPAAAPAAPVPNMPVPSLDQDPFVDPFSPF